MADNENNQGGGSLMEQVQRDLNKSANESAKAALKKLVSTKAEHEKSIRQIDVEIADLLDKHSKGLL